MNRRIDNKFRLVRIRKLRQGWSTIFISIAPSKVPILAFRVQRASMQAHSVSSYSGTPVRRDPDGNIPSIPDKDPVHA